MSVMIPIGKPVIGQEEIDSVVSVLKSGMLAQGECTKKFEESLAKYCGYKYAIAVSSGTAALHLAALSLDLRGSVAVPDFTFAATANAVKFCGGRPVFVDIDARTFNMDSVSLKSVKDIEAVIPASLFGQPYGVDEIVSFCKDNGLRIISDNAQSLGAEWKGDKNFGDDVSIFSFYPTKNITTGEGGAILTDDGEIAEDCASLRNHGQKEKYSYENVGYNYRMTELSAAMGLAQIKKLDDFIKARIRNASILTELLQGSSVETPFVDKRCRHVFNQYTIKTDEREELIKNLVSNNIGYGIYYPSPLHMQKAFNSQSDCPVTSELCKKVISLPVHPSVTESDLHKIADVVRSSG